MTFRSSYKVIPLTDADKDPAIDVRAVLENNHGKRARIIVDADCFVLQLATPKGLNSGWQPTTYWFRAAVHEVYVLMEREILAGMLTLQAEQNGTLLKIEQEFVDKAAKIVERRSGRKPPHHTFKIMLGEKK